ncbi:MAG: nickel-dependent hydrogenase large subunit [Thiobacillus sp.]
MNSSLEGRIDIQLTRTGDAVTGVAIRSSRPQLAQKLMAGRGPDEAADLAGFIFSLCGKAQRVAAQAACEAARGLTPGRDVLRQREHTVRVEAAQEHAWRLLLSWPEQAGRAPDMPSLLALRQVAIEPARFADALDGLLETTLLGEPPVEWARRDLAGFDAWRQRSATLVAKLFADLGDGADMGLSRAPLLPALPHLDSALAAGLARQALDDAAFCAEPRWLGEPAETGALTRMADHPILAEWTVRRGRGVGARLLARLLELAELPQRLRADPVSSDRAAVVRSWTLEDNVGMAGVETSRGLLLHVVRLQDGRVADYRIIAPTEWNFQAGGPLAQALAGLAASSGLEARARLVSQSLDPCVAYGVELSDA